MKLEKIWTNFSERMSCIELYQRAAKKTARKEIELINQQAKFFEGKKDFKKISSSLHNMMFVNAKTGDHEFYNFKKRSIKKRNLDVLIHKNKQYQWLLAEAYEEFEDYLESVYAYHGRSNNDFWPLKDYGNISLSELEGKKYEWYVEQLKNKKDKPKSILNRFRKQFPNLKKIEANNKLEIDLSLAISLIKQLRNIIVHEGGVVSDKESFIKKTTNPCCLYNEGNISEQTLNFINLFFGTNKYQNLITLLEISVEPDIPIEINISLFKKLFDSLLAYAFLIYEYINSSINQNET